ncbi:MAG: hypothetical protein K0V04_39760 [Deltaproteobacteria bacterium]|nr:hypothetical protein [Deltaproteobacteria bacterium]
MDDGATWLPTHTGQLLGRAAAAARESLGSDLVGVVLVGAAMHPERASRAQRPEVLLVVEQLPLASLRALARTLAPFVDKGLRPRVVTTLDIERGADVFALELAEWKARHWLIEGEDPFGAVEIQPDDLRRTIEFKLRGLGRRLRNRVLVGTAPSGRDQGARQAVVDALDALAVVAHHTLSWLGKDAPLLDADVVGALGAALDVDAGPVEALLEQMRAKGPSRDPVQALDAILPFVDAVTTAVDALESRTSGER